MTNYKYVLKLVKQLRNDLQSNQGMTAKRRGQVIKKIDSVITAIETNTVNNSCMLMFIGKIFKLLPSIIELLTKYFGA